MTTKKDGTQIGALEAVQNGKQLILYSIVLLVNLISKLSISRTYMSRYKQKLTYFG